LNTVVNKKQNSHIGDGLDLGAELLQAVWEMTTGNAARR
jgi:hypothetical protein